jgi:hypothetical protein
VLSQISYGGGGCLISALLQQVLLVSALFTRASPPLNVAQSFLNHILAMLQRAATSFRKLPFVRLSRALSGSATLPVDKPTRWQDREEPLADYLESGYLPVAVGDVVGN